MSVKDLFKKKKPVESKQFMEQKAQVLKERGQTPVQETKTTDVVSAANYLNLLIILEDVELRLSYIKDELKKQSEVK